MEPVKRASINMVQLLMQANQELEEIHQRHHRSFFIWRGFPYYFSFGYKPHERKCIRALLKKLSQAADNSNLAAFICGLRLLTQLFPEFSRRGGQYLNFIEDCFDTHPVQARNSGETQILINDKVLTKLFSKRQEFIEKNEAPDKSLKLVSTKALPLFPRERWSFTALARRFRRWRARNDESQQNAFNQMRPYEICVVDAAQHRSIQLGAINFLQQLAHGNSATAKHACAQLADLYRKGNTIYGFEENKSQAINFYQKAAEDPQPDLRSILIMARSNFQAQRYTQAAHYYVSYFQHRYQPHKVFDSKALRGIRDLLQTMAQEPLLLALNNNRRARRNILSLTNRLLPKNKTKDEKKILSQVEKVFASPLTTRRAKRAFEDESLIQDDDQTFQLGITS